MTLDDFLKETRRKGSIPISYKEFTDNLEGATTMIEYHNPAFKEPRKALAGLLERKEEREDEKDDDLVSKLYGEEIVIRTKDGYHFGTLEGYDGKHFLLAAYLFSDELMMESSYLMQSPFEKEKAIIPADKVISISRIREF